MKLPLSWLKEYIDITNSSEEIENLLTNAGLEVESIEKEANTQDIVFDIALTPNLGHCASLIGTARELSASTKKAMKYPKISIKESDNDTVTDKIKVKVEDAKACPRYACRVIRSVRVGPSPESLQRRLLASGIRPINNIVDVVNYVVLELGHPLHAFDYDTIAKQEIIVRRAREGERIVTLDDKERALLEHDLLICDGEKPVAIAGVMGGKNSEVTESTKNVLIESAYFHPGTIRKTSKHLGLLTDASKRFERGTDFNQVIKSLDRVAQLLQEISQGSVSRGTIDVKEQDLQEKKIGCRLSRINKVLGKQFSVSEVESILQRLDMPYIWDKKDQFLVTIPSYRVDITSEVDLIEEVIRIYGYANLPVKEALYHASTLGHAPIFIMERAVRSKLISEGLQEFLTCDLIGPTLSAIVKESLMPEEAQIQVLNPTSIEQSILRTSLLPGLLQLVKYNVDHQNRDVSGFEIGRIHFKKDEKYQEQSMVGVIITGKASPQQWKDKPTSVDFFDLKGIVENVLSELRVEQLTFKKSTFDLFHPGRQASLFVNGLELGSLGEVHPAITRRLDVPQRIFYAELNLQDIMKVRKPDVKMKPLSIYPSSERDWTLTVKDEMPVQHLFSLIEQHKPSHLEHVLLLDIYQSDKIGQGLKNITLHFVYRDTTKTIDQQTVDSEHGRMVQEVNARI